MKERLNEVSMKNWMTCIDKAFAKSGVEKSELDYLAALHFKRSLYFSFVSELGLTPEQTIYLENYGHLGQVDQILSLHLALKLDKITEGSIISMIAAGIGYAWGANVIRWGKVKVNDK
jgi:3-oxoacyl-[acyl-carrier-protein] synthase-3